MHVSLNSYCGINMIKEIMDERRDRRREYRESIQILRMETCVLRKHPYMLYRPYKSGIRVARGI